MKTKRKIKKFLNLKVFFFRKEWLRVTGSPQSSIDKAEFKNEQKIDQPSFPDFSIKKKNN